PGRPAPRSSRQSSARSPAPPAPPSCRPPGSRSSLRAGRRDWRAVLGTSARIRKPGRFLAHGLRCVLPSERRAASRWPWYNASGLPPKTGGRQHRMREELMSRNAALLATILLSLIASPALAGPKEDVAAATAKWADTLAKNDPDAVTALYAKDGVL